MQIIDLKPNEKAITYRNGEESVFIRCDGTSAAFTVNLPDPGLFAQPRSVTIVKNDSSSNYITVSGKINGLTVVPYVLNYQYDYISLVCDKEKYIAAGVENDAFREGDFINPTNMGTRARTNENIAIACAYAQTVNKSVILTGGTYTGSSNYNFLNVPINVGPGCYPVVESGKTIVGFNPLPCTWQVIDGAGTVTYSDKVSKIHFEWRGAAGDKSTDDTTPISRTLTDYQASTSETSVKKIQLLGVYKCTNTITINYVINIVGNDKYLCGEVSGYYQTGFLFEPTSEKTFFDIDKPAGTTYLGKIYFEGFFIEGNTVEGGSTFSKYAIDLKQIAQSDFKFIGISGFQIGIVADQCSWNHYHRIFISKCSTEAIQYGTNLSDAEGWSFFQFESCAGAGTLKNLYNSTFSFGKWENTGGWNIYRECGAVAFVFCSCEQVPRTTDVSRLNIFDVGVSGTTVNKDAPQLIINSGKYLGNISGGTPIGKFINCNYTNGIVVESVNISTVTVGIYFTANTKDYSVSVNGLYATDTVTLIYSQTPLNKITGSIFTGNLSGNFDPITYSKYFYGSESIIPRHRLNTEPGSDNAHLRLNACGGSSQDYTRGAGLDLSGVNVSGGGEVAGQATLRTGDSAAALINLIVNAVLALKLDASGDATVYRKLISGNDIESGNNILVALNKAILAKTAGGKVAICGGITDSDGTGARIQLFSNTDSGQPGDVDISAGNIDGAVIRLNSNVRFSGATYYYILKVVSDLLCVYKYDNATNTQQGEPVILMVG